MKPIEEILSKVREGKGQYDNCKLSLTADQTEILRTLSLAYSDLSEHRIEANEKWNSIYFSKQGSNALRSKEADKEVPELYMIRRTMESTKILIDTVRSTLSSARSER